MCPRCCEVRSIDVFDAVRHPILAHAMSFVIKSTGPRGSNVSGKFGRQYRSGLSGATGLGRSGGVTLDDDAATARRDPPLCSVLGLTA